MNYLIHFISIILIIFSFIYKSESTFWIVNGEETTIDKIPYIVSLQTYKYKKHVCGGSIIGWQWILTAAHCVMEKDFYYIRVGSSYSSKGGKIYNCSQIFFHPCFDIRNAYSDIAIMKLDKKIDKYSISKTIDLPESGAVFHHGALVRVSGWGLKSENGAASKQIRTVIVTVFDREICNRIYRGKILDGMMCAEKPGGKKGSCQMDSGGPLVYNEALVIGIVSWGRGCSDKYYPGVYTDVSYFRNWIEKITGI